MSFDFVLYGAYGASGALVAELAKKHGLRPLLAGRDAKRLGRIADELQLPCSVCNLEDGTALHGLLSSARILLNCAGPFVDTAPPLVDACLAEQVHYLDITGEWRVFEALAQRHAEAVARGIMLMPGVGFDVAASDCLAVHLKERLPSARTLRIGIRIPDTMSAGTLGTALDSAGDTSFVRREGLIVPVPMGGLRRVIDLGQGPVPAISVPLGDIASAFYSTGIPNVEVYAQASTAMRLGVAVQSFAGPMLRNASVRGLLKRGIRWGVGSPSAQDYRGTSRVWGEVSDGERVVVSRLEGRDQYPLTAELAIGSVRAVLERGAAPGFRAPGAYLGADFPLHCAGMQRTEEPASTLTRAS